MKLLVAGCGSIGRRHAANAARMADTAVFDPVPASLQACARATGAAAFADYGEALAWGPDAVVVAAPTSLHLELASRAVAAGAHVLVEKPLSHSPDGVPGFLDAAEAAGRKVYVACNMRFHPAVQAMRRAMEGIGRPLYARAHYGNYLPAMRPGCDYRSLYCARSDMGGGVVLDAIHELDYLMWLFGPVDAVQCHAATLGDLGIDVEDFAALCMTHGSGVRSLVQLDFLRRHKRRGCEIVGTEGTVIWQSEGKKPHRCLVRSCGPDGHGWTTLLHEEDLDGTASYEVLLRRFVDALEGGDDADLLTGRGAAAVLDVALEARGATAQAARAAKGDESNGQ